MVGEHDRSVGKEKRRRRDEQKKCAPVTFRMTRKLLRMKRGNRRKKKIGKGGDKLEE